MVNTVLVPHFLTCVLDKPSLYSLSKIQWVCPLEASYCTLYPVPLLKPVRWTDWMIVSPCPCHSSWGWAAGGKVN